MTFPLMPTKFDEVYTSAQLTTPEGCQSPIPVLGSTLVDPATGSVYRFVQHIGGEARVIGDVVGYSYAAGLGYRVDQYTSGETMYITHMAGVCMGPIPAGGAGWIQIWGYNALIQVEGTSAISIGESLKMVDGHDYAVKDAAAGTRSSYEKYIVALAAYSTAAASRIKGFIYCF